MTLDFIIKLVAVIAFVVVLVAIEAVAMCFIETIKETSSVTPSPAALVVAGA